MTTEKRGKEACSWLNNRRRGSGARTDGEHLRKRAPDASIGSRHHVRFKPDSASAQWRGQRLAVALVVWRRRRLVGLHSDARDHSYHVVPRVNGPPRRPFRKAASRMEPVNGTAFVTPDAPSKRGVIEPVEELELNDVLQQRPKAACSIPCTIKRVVDRIQLKDISDDRAHQSDAGPQLGRSST